MITIKIKTVTYSKREVHGFDWETLGCRTYIALVAFFLLSWGSAFVDVYIFFSIPSLYPLSYYEIFSMF